MATLLLGCLLPVVQVTVPIMAATLAYYIICYLSSPLKDIPGPFLARFTNLWRLYDYYHSVPLDTQKMLHAQYGTAVRLGPNMVSLNDPSLIPIIYNARGTFHKVCFLIMHYPVVLTLQQSDFYSASDALVHGHRVEHIFSTRNNQFHLEQLTPIQKLYSNQGVLAYEGLIDRVILLLCEQLETRFVNGANSGNTCDIADWISYCESYHPAVSNSV